MNVNKAVLKSPIEELWEYRRNLAKTKYEMKSKIGFLKMQSNLTPANKKILEDLVQIVDTIKT